MHVYLQWMTPDVNLHHQLYAAKICLTQDQRERLFSNTVFFIQEMAAVRSCALCVYHTYSSNCGTFFGCLYHMCEVPLFCSISIPPSQRIRLSFLTLVNLSFHTSKSVCVQVFVVRRPYAYIWISLLSTLAEWCLSIWAYVCVYVWVSVGSLAAMCAILEKVFHSEYTRCTIGLFQKKPNWNDRCSFTFLKRYVSAYNCVLCLAPENQHQHLKLWINIVGPSSKEHTYVILCSMSPNATCI